MPDSIKHHAFADVTRLMMFPVDAIEDLFDTVLRVGEKRSGPVLHVTPAEATACWAYQLLTDLLDSHTEAWRIVTTAWPTIRSFNALLDMREAATTLPLIIAIHDRSHASVAGLPAIDLTTGEYTPLPGAPLETIQLDMIELYRRNTQRLRLSLARGVAGQKDTACRPSA